MELIALLHDTVVGRLSADQNGDPQFQYDPDWQASSVAIPLSLSIPLAQTTHGADAVAPVLWGLLPDNEHTLQRWAAKFQVSARNPLALLRHIGEDCAGGVSFLQPNRVEAWCQGKYDQIQWLEASDLEERLARLRLDSGATRAPEDLGQFSLAGAQPKIALLNQDGRWGVPSGRIPTTHILKPPSGELDGLAENEHFCMTLAKALRLPVANSSVVHSGREVAFCVERYDRVARPSTILRAHQEDVCQALGLHPHRKYQNQGGPSPKDIADLIYCHSARARDDVETFFRALVFNWVIAGSDAHAKNYSLLLGPSGQVRLAPLYDLISTLPYSQIDQHMLKLSMKIGSQYQYRRVSAGDWRKLAQDLRLDPAYALKMVREMTAAVPDLALACALRLAVDGVRHPIVSTLVREIRASAQRCNARLSQ